MTYNRGVCTIFLTRGLSRSLLTLATARIRGLKRSPRPRPTSTWTKTLPNNYAILLMGSPGCGKTSTGQLLSARLAKPVSDIDDDFLEPYWGMPVAHKLSAVGNKQFIEEEGMALLQFEAKPGTIVSLTGSNPLHSEAMGHVSKSGLVVFVDVHSEDILHRLHKMKVDRLVTHKEGQSIADVLRYRRKFYERVYDLRVLCERFESVESVASKIENRLKNFESAAKYTSTRSVKKGNTNHFQDVIIRGLAEDGGLFVPSGEFPKLTLGEWSRFVDLPFQERALLILERWLNFDFIQPQVLQGFIEKAYNRSNFLSSKVIPVVKLDKGQYLMETFHGPTGSFKDAALQLMPQLFNYAVSRDKDKKSRYLILVATSGDTGSAVLDGFSKVTEDSNVRVMVLYPEHGISSVQKALMTSVDSSNVKVLGVEGDFDSCQSAIKSIFNSKTFTKQLLTNYNVKLSAANSINWGRLLPQVVYHASAYLDLVSQGVIAMGDECDVCIPTGNFGNILAAFYAREMGIPYKRFICASNINNILTEFFQSGTYNLRNRKLQVSTSPAIDILKSSNLERFLHLVTNGDGAMIKAWFESLSEDGVFQVPDKILKTISQDFNLVSDWCNEESCAETIKSVYKETGYLLDPHTSVAKTVADRQTPSDRPMIICGTAHYGKFPEDVLKALELPWTSEDNCCELLQKLKGLSASPPLNPNLEFATSRSRVHNGVIGDNVNEVKNEVEAFCANW